jgi:hypothetical protein
MIQRKGKYLTAVGILLLVVGIGLRNWPHGNHLHFAAGFFLGLSVTLLIADLVRRARRVVR